jgi:hypothetical protein
MQYVRIAMQAEHKIQSADGPLVLQLQKVSLMHVNSWLSLVAAASTSCHAATLHCAGVIQSG